MSNNPIVLKSNRLSDECIGTVRLTPEAEKVVRPSEGKDRSAHPGRLYLKLSSRPKTSSTLRGRRTLRRIDQ